MANVIQQLMVMVGGDTEGFEKALGGADKVLEEFGTSFTKIIGGLSLAVLTAEVIKSTFEISEAFEHATIQMQRATGATGEALEGMEKSFKSIYTSSTASAEAIAGALSQITQKTGAEGDLLEGLTKSEMAFAKVTGSNVVSAVEATQRIFAQWGVTTAQQSTALDVLYVAMQKSGMSADKLNSAMLSVGPSIRNLGFTFEQSAALIASFEKSGLDATDMTGGLTKAFGAFAKAHKDPMVALEALIEKMSNAETRTEALRYAMDAGFNAKTAGKFVDAVMKGAFSLTELMKALDDSTGAVSKMSKETHTLGGEWTKFSREFIVTTEPMGVAILKFLTAPLEYFNEKVKRTGSVWAALISFQGMPPAKRSGPSGFGLMDELLKPGALPVKPSEIGDPAATGADTGTGSAEQYAQRKALIDGELAHEMAAFAAEKIGYDELEKEKLISAEDYAGKMKDLLERELAAEVAAIDKKLALEKKAKTEGATDQGLSNQRQAAIDKEANAELLLSAKVNEAKHADEQHEADEYAKILTQRQAYAIKVADYVEQYSEALALDAVKTDGLKVAALMQHDTALLEQKRTRAAIEEQLGIIGAKTRIAIDLDLDKQEEALQKAAIQREIDLLDTADASYASRKQALENKLLALTDQRIAREQALQMKLEQGHNAEIKDLERIIQRKQDLGKSTAAEIVQLTNLQARQQAMNTLSAGLGTIYKGLVKDFTQAFHTISAGLVDGITGAKTWGQVWKDTLKSIETMILTTVIDAILQMAAAWILNLLLGKAASGGVAVAEVASQAAVGGAGVAAWTAAIPFIGPALAIPAGLAEYAAILGTFGPLAAFERGGLVPEDMLAMVHKGEYFLPAHETAMAAAGGGGIIIDFSNSTFNGVTQDLVNTVMNKAITAARRAGAKL